MAETATKGTRQGAPAPIPPQKAEKAPPKSPRQRFEALGPKRVDRFVSVCAMLKRFGVKSQYALTDAERARIIATVKAECAAVVAALEGQKPASNGFTLDKWTQ